MTKQEHEIRRRDIWQTYFFDIIATRNISIDRIDKVIASANMLVDEYDKKFQVVEDIV